MSERARAISALLAVQLLFGLLPVAGAAAMQSVSSAALVGVRSLSAAPLFVLIAGPRAVFGVARAEHLKLAGLAFLGVSANQLMFAEGLRLAGPVHAVVLVVLIPALTLVVAVISGRERATLGRAVGVLIALAGAASVVEIERVSLSSDTFLGDLLLLSNALCYATYLVLARPVIARLGPSVVVAWVFVFGALLALPWTAPAMAATAFATVPASAWATIVFIVLGPTIAAYALNAYALVRVDASLVAVFIALQPFVGAGASWLLLGEAVSLRTALSGLVLTAGVIIAARSPSRAA